MTAVASSTREKRFSLQSGALATEAALLQATLKYVILYNNCVFHRPFLRGTFNAVILLFTIPAL